MTTSDLQKLIRDVPDFPKPGILFKDITPLLGNAAALRATVTHLADRAALHKPDVIVAIESRGFIFGAAVAIALGIGFVPVRKPGKLPWRSRSVSYALEYGKDTLEMHEDALLQGGGRALIVDDLLATGGTASAAAELVRAVGGEVVGWAFVIELAFLGGRARLAPAAVDALIAYE